MSSLKKFNSDILGHLDGGSVMGTAISFLEVEENKAIYFAPPGDWKWGEDEDNRPIEGCKLELDKKYRDILGADEEIVIFITNRKTYEDYVSSKIARDVIEEND